MDMIVSFYKLLVHSLHNELLYMVSPSHLILRKNVDNDFNSRADTHFKTCFIVDDGMNNFVQETLQF